MRPIPLWLAAALLLILFGACVRGEGLTLPKDASRLPEDQVVTLLKEVESGVAASRRTVILNESDWRDFWSLVYSGRVPPPNVHRVNFADSMVIVAASGARPNGGYGIDFEAVGRVGDDYHLVVRQTSVARSCRVREFVSNPVVAVRVARTSGKVSFIETTATLPC